MPNIRKYQDHIVCSYGYKLIFVDEQDSQLYNTYYGEDAIRRFSNHVIKESRYCFKVTETKFNEPLVIAKKNQKDF